MRRAQDGTTSRATAIVPCSRQVFQHHKHNASLLDTCAKYVHRRLSATTQRHCAHSRDKRATRRATAHRPGHNSTPCSVGREGAQLWSAVRRLDLRTRRASVNRGSASHVSCGEQCRNNPRRPLHPQRWARSERANSAQASPMRPKLLRIERKLEDGRRTHPRRGAHDPDE